MIICALTWNRLVFKWKWERKGSNLDNLRSKSQAKLKLLHSCSHSLSSSRELARINRNWMVWKRVFSNSSWFWFILDKQTSIDNNIQSLKYKSYQLILIFGTLLFTQNSICKKVKGKKSGGVVKFELNCSGNYIFDCFPPLLSMFSENLFILPSYLQCVKILGKIENMAKFN